MIVKKERFPQKHINLFVARGIVLVDAMCWGIAALDSAICTATVPWLGLSPTFTWLD